MPGRDKATMSAAQFEEALLADVQDDPKAFQALLAKLVQDTISQGIREIEPPRNIRELAVWFDVLRKAAGLDGKGPVAPAGVVSPLRSLRRAPRVIEAEEVPEDPLDGFVL